MSKKLSFATRVRVFVAVAMIALISGPSMAQLYSTMDPTDLPVPGLNIQVSLGNALNTGRIGGKRFSDAGAMKVFYKARENQPFWTGEQSQAEEFVRILEKSWMHGLNPERYHAGQIRELVDHPNFLKRAQLELLLTDAFMRYVQDMTGMRVDTKGLRVDDKSWRQPMHAEQILPMLDSGKSITRIMRAIEPQGRTYKKLQQALIDLAQQPEEDFASVLPIDFGGLLKPGLRWGHKRIPDLRVRLGVQKQTNDPYLYDDALAAAVMKFQRENGLMPDGIIGSSTLQLLNRTNKDKMLQLIANMERLRWVEEKRPEKFVVVNIPSATLWAVDRGRVEFEMPVIVGSPWRRTQSFITEIEGVRLNPDWTIPPTIKRFDIVPKVQEDPDYLAGKGIELIQGYGRNAITLDPDAIDWHNITNQELHKIRMVQIPGDHNPLGRVRVLMPNKYNIYLHDTNHPELFDRPERALSSGCIRMKDPKRMAQFIMKGERNWRRSMIGEVIETNEKTDIEISQSIPVYVLYYTAWIDDRGQVVYGTDIYKQDRKLIEKLVNIDGFSIPGHNVKTVAGSNRYKLVSAD